MVIRATIAVMSWALLVGIVSAECVLTPAVESSGHVTIHVTLGGKPLKGARVIVRPSHECTCAYDVLRGNPLDTSMLPSDSSQVTDENGVANLSELAPGDYDVAASINDVASTAFVGLHVSESTAVTTIPMDLTLQVQRIEELPVRLRVGSFRGTVRDVSGALVPEARIVVVKRGSQARYAVKDKADAKGNFSIELPEGSYIAIFFFRGFRAAIEPFELTGTGTQELQIRLSPGGCY